MSYAIPANIEYKEKIVGPLDMKQTLYLAIFLALGGGAFFFSGLPPVIGGFIALVFAVTGLSFAMFELDVWIKNYIHFIRIKKPVSWTSSLSRKFMNVDSMKAETVFLRDGRAVAVVKVIPINFAILSDQDKDSVIYGFLEFLNSLDFPIQIVMRSVDLRLDEYLRNLKRRITQRGDEISYRYFQHFERYIQNYLQLNKVNDRLFYVVVPARVKKEERDTLKNLENRCNIVVATLSISGVTAYRMSDAELIRFYSSYFTSDMDVATTTLSPITMYPKMWAEKPSDERRELFEESPGVKEEPVSK